VTGVSSSAAAVKRSVAVVVHAPGEPERILAVKRPPDDEDLPDAWGLPAASPRPDESWVQAVLRTGRDKLGVRLGGIRFMRMGEASRPGLLLHMRLYRAEIEEGQPRVPGPVEGVTQYVDLAWCSPRRLVPAARRGSLCSRLFLEVLGRSWRGEEESGGAPPESARRASPTEPTGGRRCTSPHDEE
jgi:ADP-ribose pyrophosphatase YjhB (NUDIX family)